MGSRGIRSLRFATILVAVVFAAGCDRGAGGAAPRAAVGQAATAPATATANHDYFAQQGIQCATCHPCGASATHGVAWMDQASPTFHAVAADSGLANCQSCHGAKLDGVGGATAVSCAMCHGASWTTSCTMCHGGADNQTGAPPAAIWGQAGDPARGGGTLDPVRVGAHTAHLAAPHGLASPLACTSCHVVPADAFAAGHVDGSTATVIFSGLATQGATPSWSRPSATCASTYCHGATLNAGGTNTSPVWTTTDGSQIACGTCHGAPPPVPHPQNAACGSCHPGYTATTVNAATHVDGAVQLSGSGLTCASCHGTAGVNAAPPFGTHGETATSSMAVGAHQSHLQGGALAGPLACGECHVVPTSMTHANGTVNVTFGPIATTGGTQPAFDFAAGTCSSTYCHGQFPGGNALNAPLWNVVDGTQDACGSCHGAPPPVPHPQDASCGACHPGYSATTVNTATHVNGIVDVAGGAVTCTSCHGTAGVNAAPPIGTRGETATTAPAVGAHQVHLSGGPLASPIACGECHVVPTSMTHANGTADVTFGPLSRTGGAQPTFNAASNTCASTYCHGATLNAGGTLTTPFWNVVDGTQDACGTCHGAPPPVPHPQDAACGTCHPGYSATTVNTATHVNGIVDIAGGAVTCTSCHGTVGRTSIAGADANQAAAPPIDSHGNTAVTARGVGVHVQHVNQATWRSAPIACSECHFNAVPTSMTHADGTVQLAFGALAKNASWGGVTPAPVWNGTTCAGTYCHGAFKNGANATATWTQAGGAACGSCHALPPAGGHPANTNCGSCHSGYTITSVNAAAHMNGALEVSVTCTSCHGNSAQSATASAPRYAAPPVDTLGASTGLRVGAHQSHVVGKTYSSGIACQDCHPSVATYTGTHSNGVSNVAFTNGTSTSFNTGTYTPRNGTTAATCASTWCHAVADRKGNGSDGTTPTQSWTNTITSCTSCHGSPPSTGSHGINSSHSSCGNCHSNYGSNTVNKSLHVNGTRDVGGSGTQIQSWNSATMSCQPRCHGTKTWGGGSSGWGGGGWGH